MKILITVNEFPPDIVAGTAMSTLYLCEHLAKRGLEVHVVVTCNDHNRAAHERVNRIFVHRIKPIGIRGTRVLQRFFQLYRIASVIQPDILQGQSVSCGMLVCLVGRFISRPSITCVQGYDLYHAGPVQRLTEVRFALQCATAVTTVTEDLKDLAEKIYPRPDIIVLPHGLETSNENPSVVDIAAGTDNCRHTVLFVGQLVERKGLRYLIASMKKVRANCPQARLLIIGQGDGEHVFRKMVADLDLGDTIRFLGPKIHQEVLAWMRLAKVFVLPSVEEAFGIVLIEAMSQGLPVVATRVQGIPYIVQDGINGFLVPIANENALAERLIFLLNDRQTAARMGERNRKDALRFHWPILVEKYIALYNCLGGEKP